MIRLARPQDAERIRAIYAPAVTDTPASFEITVPTEAEMAERIAARLETHPWLVCWDDGGVQGYCYASQHRARAAYRWSTDVTVYVDLAAHRRGIGRSLYTALLALLTEQGFVRAYAGITLPNPASVGLHEAVGFRHIGTYSEVGYKHGAWHSVGWWERPLADAAADPPEPRPFAAFIAERPDILAKAGVADA